MIYIYIAMDIEMDINRDRDRYVDLDTDIDTKQQNILFHCLITTSIVVLIALIVPDLSVW